MQHTNISFRSTYDGDITKGIEFLEEEDLLQQIAGILAQHNANSAVILFPYNCSYPL